MSFAVSPRRRAMMEKLQPLRDFFIVIFFVHLGMLVDISVVKSYLWEIIGLTLFVIVAKPAITYFIVTYF
jgi:Kef-type K+ transport system membrane component KefB